jgi:ABC-type polysaccharide/polyol phosphate transport system ATPase subunit
MSSKPVITAKDLSKAYTMYAAPRDRLKQMIFGNRRKYYQEFWALRGASLEINRGETVGIIGRNGCGKSTLLQMICGTLNPTSGTIHVDGRVAALLELGAGFNPEFTGIENIRLNAMILGLSSSEIEDRLERIIAFADIGAFINQPVKTFSSGMYARLAFAVAVHVDPEILIVDEILAVGDAAFQRKCVEKFYEIRAAGTTVLFVSHDAYQVKNLCDRAIYLKNGQIEAIGPADSIVDQYTFDLENAAKTKTPAGPDQKDSSVSEPGKLFAIDTISLEDHAGNQVNEVKSGSDLRLRFSYRAVNKTFPDELSFVFNLYRHDGLYVCGVTTLMEKLPPFKAYSQGEVIISFPKLSLLAGQYTWRVALNDAGGLYVHAQASHVCEFKVIDDFQAVGLVDIPHVWESREL